MYKAQTTDGEIVAIKQLENYDRSFCSMRDTLREIFVLRKMSSISKNSYTNRLIDIIFDVSDEKNKSIYLVLEYAQSDLRKLITHQSQVYSEEHIIIFLYNILCALNLLHSGGIAHRDIKPANILVNGNSSIRICDFGMSRVIPDASEKRDRDRTPDVCTRVYRSPEIILFDRNYGTAVDIWSLGCVLYELIWGCDVYHKNKSK